METKVIEGEPEVIQVEIDRLRIQGKYPHVRIWLDDKELEKVTEITLVCKAHELPCLTVRSLLF